ncbi:CK1 family protein kinase [Trichomonas vaginalis G3]|uniref:non-specific serine/threonine protein kinase n=1 Tax=Trichomonas vaginalis (strain ATCC PRA-98 / G3) TaxID=412133 RepID=A2GHL0_TRIV3|nr:protein kinase protein [Trichomonas vaginalis G3]EAX83357.1 CK1 family protein kinase [Trichomonas vaginalis G3]KAI5523225.1 protein kinase protein [Trichomonas vaginalis G3]|eukprot:XP_001296287.1 CK1 family protein kinase [Trichomonas vaginalis G3]
MDVPEMVGFYKILEPIGHGGFGQVYLVKSTEDDQYYAMKIEKLDSKIKSLEFEVTVIKRLHNSDRFPRILSSGKEGDLNYFVMELFGPSLHTIAEWMPSGYINRLYIYRLADEMLSCIEHLHKNGYIHRDIKPHNFVLRLNGTFPLALLDFGISKQYIDRDGNHLPARDSVHIAWSPYYASLNSHKHKELSRRDDLISWLFSVMALTEFKLPWQTDDHVDDIERFKQKYELAMVVNPLGQPFKDIATYIQSLDYSDTPDYAKIHKLILDNIPETQFPYQWMKFTPEDVVFRFDPSANNYDPTGFIISKCPQFKYLNTKKCLLI